MVTIALSTYNVARYVEAALRSILSQTYVDIEVLCIDDASTDGTWEIVERYASADSRMRVIRQEYNQGLSVSRNLALKEARGEWILMVDGDDMMSPDLVCKAVGTAERDGSDMVIWDYCEFTDESEITEAAARLSALTSVKPTDKAVLLGGMSFTWIRLIRTNVMRRLGIVYPEGRTKQDIPAHWREILSIDNISVLPERLSYYRLRPGATSMRRGRSLLDLSEMYLMVEEYLRSSGLFDKYSRQIALCRLNAWYVTGVCIDKEFRPEVRASIIEDLSDLGNKHLREALKSLPMRQKIFFQAMTGRSLYRGLHLLIQIAVAVKHKLR